MGKLARRLKDASRSGVYRATRADEVLEAARDATLDNVRIDARREPLTAIAKALDFPDWFGGNWDALEDCLGDLSWRPGGHVLVFTGFPHGDDLGVLIDVLRSSAQFWAERSRPFFAVFIDPRRELTLPNLFREA
jgi:RNAse (barnase) inhibitor barstar